MILLVTTLEKCSFCYSEIEYLGFRISTESIRLSQRHLKAISKIEPPKNVKSLQRLLGLFNSFKKHIPRYSHNTAHMRQLLVKKVPFIWSPECQAELTYLHCFWW